VEFNNNLFWKILLLNLFVQKCLFGIPDLEKEIPDLKLCVVN